MSWVCVHSWANSSQLSEPSVSKSRAQAPKEKFHFFLFCFHQNPTSFSSLHAISSLRELNVSYRSLVTFCRSVCLWLVAGWFSFLVSPVTRLEDYGKLQPCPQVLANVLSCLTSAAVLFLFWSACAQNEITQKRHLLWWCWIMITLVLPALDLYTAGVDKLIKTLETHY